MSGYAGWTYLARTRDAQTEVLSESPRIARNLAAIREDIAQVRDVETLMANRPMLEVALGAFGLEDDINNRFLISRILESDTADPASLANRFSDKRYLAMADFFGFGNIGGPRTGDTGFADRLSAAYLDRSFEVAVGESDPTLRLALGFGRELDAVTARKELSDDARWFTIMATRPLRKVFEGALGLPAATGALDLDRQLTAFRSRAEAAFGTSDLAELSGTDMRPQIVRRFLAQAQISAAVQATTPAASALAILTAGGGRP